jgi:hypothetical protein
MRNVRAMNVLPPLLLAGALALPASASAFWFGPGCFLTNMLGGGGFSGGFGFSAGTRGLGYGHPYGALPLYGGPYPLGPPPHLMSPGPLLQGGAAPQRPAEVLRANIWSLPTAAQPEAPDAQPVVELPAPRNRWQP